MSTVYVPNQPYLAGSTPSNQVQSTSNVDSTGTKRKKKKAAEPTPNVNYVRSEVNDNLLTWQLMRDACAGQQAIAAAANQYPSLMPVSGQPISISPYVPAINPMDSSLDNLQRNRDYLTRGNYYNFTGRTRDGMVGTVFSKEPIVTLPEELLVLYNDVDGSGLTMDQQAQGLLAEVLTTGRVGIFVDYPQTNADTTRLQELSGEVRPTLITYRAEEIINWRTTTINGIKRLSLVVLLEQYPVDDDGFAVTYGPQWRVLRLDDAGEYTVQVYRQKVDTSAMEVGKLVKPLTGKSRKPFKYIPFTFVGAKNNDSDVGPMPLLDLANLNIAHFRNSCDFEEMVYVLGQPTPVLIGLSKNWVDEVMGGTVVLGSTNPILLPEKADAKLLQLQESQLSLEAMKQKKEDAISLGARLVQGNYVQRSAKEAGLDDESETSLLMTAAKNITKAYAFALRAAGAYVGVLVKDAAYLVNTNFDVLRMSTLDRQQLLLEWQAGLITFPEARSILRKGNIATVDDDEAMDQLEEYPAPLGVEPGAPGNKTEPPVSNVNGDPVSPLAPNKRRKAAKMQKKSPGQIPRKPSTGR
jgi:hypothetical protein